MYEKCELLEIRLKDEGNFLKIRETLTRIGIASKVDKKLYQTAHILHKKGRYYIVHFKELFMLDGREMTLSAEDILRRDAIALLLEEWDLIEILGKVSKESKEQVSKIKVLSFKEKKECVYIGYSMAQLVYWYFFLRMFMLY